MKLMKMLLNHNILILLCLLLFVLYVIFDRNYYRCENFKSNPNFNLIGNPNDTEFGVLAYDNIAKGIINSDNDTSFLNVFDGLKEKFENDDEAKQRYYTIKKKENKKFFNLENIKRDLKYFNNATHLFHANETNSIASTRGAVPRRPRSWQGGRKLKKAVTGAVDRARANAAAAAKKMYR